MPRSTVYHIILGQLRSGPVSIRGMTDVLSALVVSGVNYTGIRSIVVEHLFVCQRRMFHVHVLYSQINANFPIKLVSPRSN